MWHFHHASSKDFLFAKQLLYSLQSSGKIVFPDYHTMWHFDDKVGQKYLLEAIEVPVVPTHVFYSKNDALTWAKETSFPKVFKLSTGGGSQNVRMARSRSEAKKLINKAFKRGFSQYSAWSNLRERIRKYRNGQASFYNILKGVIRLGHPTKFSRVKGNEKGYVYFQDFIPNNEFDIRVVVIDMKAFAIKRMVRKNDFRASGSGTILYEKENFDDNTIRLAIDSAEKLKSQCVAFDYIYDNENPLLVEISYGFSPEGYDSCTGYWDKDLNWHEGSINPYGWMVDMVLRDYGQSNG